MTARRRATALLMGFALCAVACSEGACGASTAVDPPTETLAPESPAQTHLAPGPWAELASPAAVGSLGASLTATSEGVLLTWLEPRPEDAHAVRFATLGGDEWGGVRTVVEAGDVVANWADFPRAARGGDEAIYVHYLRRSGSAAYAYEIQLMRMAMGAANFEPLGVLHHDGTPTEHGFVSMLPEADGVRLFWLDGRASDEGGATAIYTSRVAGESIGQETRLDDKTCDCCQTDAALAAGGPLLVYRDREEGEVRDIASVRWTGEAFSAPAAVHRDEWEMAGCPVNGPAVDARERRVVVAWFTGADGGSTRLAFSDDGGESFEEPVVIDPAQPLGRVDVALLDGGAAVSWLARGSGEAEIRARFVHRDGRLGAPTSVARTASARASGFPVMVRDGERLLVAYRDGAEPPEVHIAQLPSADLPRGAGETESEAPAPTLLAIGDPMPEALVRDAEGETVALGTLRSGGPLVVAFFARWCQPCREELAQLQALEALLGPTARVVAVSIDEGSVERATPVARRWGFEGRVVSDAGAAAALGVPPIPALFAFGADGELVGAWRGQAVTAREVAQRLTDS